VLDELQQQVPLVNTATPQNFREIAELLRTGTTLVPAELEYARVVQRGLEKKAPYHSGKNSVADALLIELYATQVRQRGPGDVYCFVTSNYSDFSVPNSKPGTAATSCGSPSVAVTTKHGNTGSSAASSRHYGGSWGANGTSLIPSRQAGPSTRATPARYARPR
jgi:hypothetical protein